MRVYFAHAAICVRSWIVASGCTTVQHDARIRRQAEAVVWGALAAPSPAMRERATRIVADVADPLLDRGLGTRMGDPQPSVRATAAVALGAADAARRRGPARDPRR